MGATIKFIKTTKEQYEEIKELKKKIDNFSDFETEQEEEEYDKLYDKQYDLIQKVTVAEVDCGYSQVQKLRMVMLSAVASPLLWEYIDTHKHIFGLSENWRTFGGYYAKLICTNEDVLQMAVTGTFAYIFNDCDDLVSMLDLECDKNIIGEDNEYKFEGHEVFNKIEEFSLGYIGRDGLTNKEIREVLSKSNGLHIS